MEQKMMSCRSKVVVMKVFAVTIILSDMFCNIYYNKAVMF